ncbi:hypothetical protein [Krasilnikovia sp. MM14-A1259]|uniref:hypothetical protein n=1 Tax=Krasilnikovia sp. MM14-A1259 TaxID=3373539 RepID=UPI00381812CB
MNLDVVDASDLPAGVVTASWVLDAPTPAAADVIRPSTDPRWQTRYLIAAEGGEVLGITPLSRPRTQRMADRDYDLRLLVASSDRDDIPADAREWLVIGGAHSLRGGILIHRDLPDSAAARVRAAIADRAVGLTTHEGLYGAAPYVGRTDRDAFVSVPGAGWRSVESAAAATIEVPPESMDAYLASLAPDRRRNVRRDWRHIAAAGLATACGPAEEAIENAAVLVAAVKIRHGVMDDPRIAAYRLHTWLNSRADEHLAFTVTSPEVGPVATSFVARTGDSLEVHEIGMIDDENLRHLGYIEAGFYAPIRYALATGGRSVHLGTESPAPKRHRGAKFTPLYLAYSMRDNA